MPLQPGLDVELTIEKPAAGGRMIARHAGQVVLVSGAIPGERVRVRIERVARGVAYGIARDVLRADDSRRGTAEERPCGGMVYAHIAYPRQLELKAAILADAFLRIARVPLEAPIPVESSPEQGYRMRARVHPRAGRLGFFREGTHELCDPATTGQLLPSTLEAVARLADRMTLSASVGPLSVDLGENIPATERVVHLEFDGPVSPRDLAWIEGAGLTGATYGSPHHGAATTLFGQAGVTDVVHFPTPESAAPVGPNSEAAAGQGSPSDGEQCLAAVAQRGSESAVGQGFSPARFASVTLWRRASAFFQANRYLLPTLLSRVVAQVGPGDVVDLYAGVGLFSLALAAAGRGPVVAVEGDPTSAEDLRRNLARFGSGITGYAMPVERFLAGRRVPADSTLVVDPPRTGMTREAMDGVLAHRAPRIVYVSCDVATLARDAGRLVSAGYSLTHLEAFDLFPNTAHVEALAAFAR